MKKLMVVALTTAFSVAGTGVALAEVGPDFAKPFGSRSYSAPSVATMPAGGPVASDTDARTRLQADGYRAIDGLSRGADGAWHGTAIRGAAKVNVTVGPDGRIFTR